jgi:biopolymer transport protein ExbB
MLNWDSWSGAAQRLWERAVAIWIAGDWGMVAIAVDALVLFGIGTHIWLRLRERKFTSVPERVWRQWILRPEERRGPVGEILDFVTGEPTIEQTAESFAGLRTIEEAPFTRDLKVMKICVGVAPLLGLFGTVTGMLATFGALATGGGGQKTMGMIAEGISEALITTETGLVIALPGLFFQYQLSRRFERYKAFLSHVETVVTQLQYRKLKGARTSEMHYVAVS